MIKEEWSLVKADFVKYAELLIYTKKYGKYFFFNGAVIIFLCFGLILYLTGLPARIVLLLEIIWVAASLVFRKYFYKRSRLSVSRKSMLLN